MSAGGFDEGRYVYCVVSAPDDASFEATGVDGSDVRLVAADGLGAVVHDRGTVYDSDDLREVKRWLLAHQSVVDRAGEAFGTPLPFRFDTILDGDDESVREWLRENRTELSDHLDSLAGHWEYRIEVVQDEDVATEAADDAELADIDARRADAGEGTAYLLDRQYEKRLAELRVARQEELAVDLRERLEPYAVRLERRDGDGQLVGSEEDSSEAGASGDGADESGGLAVGFAVLAHEDSEGDIGAELDGVAAAPGVEVRFTGPWPPYSFAPELGGGA